MFNLQKHQPPPPLKDPAKENINVTSTTSTPASYFIPDDPRIRYGNGTFLDTISEKRSNSTLRTSLTRTVSLNDLGAKMLLIRHRDSLTVIKAPRHKTSWSEGDMVVLSDSYHNALAAIADKPQINTESIYRRRVYAAPALPISAPPNRPPTPEGMPSWTEHQRHPPARPQRQTRTQSAPPMGFRRLFSGLASSLHLTASPEPPRTVATEREREVAALPRFRPPRSVYSPLNQHPYSTSPAPTPKAIPALRVEPPTAPPRLAKIRGTHAVERPVSRVPQFIQNQRRKISGPMGLRLPQIVVESVPLMEEYPSSPEQSPEQTRPAVGRMRMSPGLGGLTSGNGRLETPTEQASERRPQTPLMFDRTPTSTPRLPAVAPKLQQSGRNSFQRAREDGYTPLPCQTANLGTGTCQHQRHAGFEMRSPDYFSPLTLPDFNLRPVLTPWRSRSPSRQLDGSPGSVLGRGEESPGSVDSRTRLMSPNRSEGSMVRRVGGERRLDERRLSPLGDRDGGNGTREGGFRMLSHDETNHKPPGDGCWKCRFDEGLLRLERWLGRCLCFLCCGVEREGDQEVSVETAREVRIARSVSGNGNGESARRDGSDEGSRRGNAATGVREIVIDRSRSRSRSGSGSGVSGGRADGLRMNSGFGESGEGEGFIHGVTRSATRGVSPGTAKKKAGTMEAEVRGGSRGGDEEDEGGEGTVTEYRAGVWN